MREPVLVGQRTAVEQEFAGVIAFQVESQASTGVFQISFNLFCGLFVWTCEDHEDGLGDN